MIGYFGDIVFKVSEGSVLTFKDFTRDISIRIEKYDIQGRKPLSSSSGPELQTINLSIQLMQSLTPDVDSELEKIAKMCEGEKAEYFSLGGKILGSDRWIITNVTEERKVISNLGKTLSAELQIQLEEYITEV